MSHHWPPPNWRLSRPQVLSFAPGTRATQFSKLAGKFGHFTCICESLGRVVSGPGATASLGDGSFECTSSSFDRTRASAELAISEPSGHIGHTKLSDSLLTSSRLIGTWRMSVERLPTTDRLQIQARVSIISPEHW